ncbi:MAG: hypothetical protein ABI759_22090 [Candidatus Solibacter sp.]
MKRYYFMAMFAVLGLQGLCAQEKKQIVLYCDLNVDAAKEAEMLKNYHTIFFPAAQKYPGYIDLKLTKFHSAASGKAPEGANYRFQLAFESEEARQKWIKSDIHGKVWPTIENLLSTKNYPCLIYDIK